MKNKHRKFKRNYIFTSTLLLLTIAITHIGRAKIHHPFAFDNYLTALTDTIPPSMDSIPVAVADTLIKKNKPDSLRGDSAHRVKVDTFSVKMSKDSIDAPVEYEAKDSMVLDVTAQKLYLYGETGVKYKDVDLKAPEIVFDQQTNMVKARMKLDTAGKILGQATLVQGDMTTVNDSLEFNFKTQKGLTHSSYFQQSELYNYAQVVKKVDAQTIYAFKGRFTTCNLDTPHFAFRARKIKYISKKMAVTGPVGVEFENVPVLPIILPFGMFPLQQGRHSGFLPPQFTVTDGFGLGLEGLGYYKVINDNFDITTRADIYSYGSWRLNLSPTYRVRYRYNGSLNFSYQNTHQGFKGDADYAKNKSFFLTWSHRMDSKARPGVNFSASVNAGSSSYTKYLPTNAIIDQSNGAGGSYSQPQSFANQLSSSISYQKTWIGKPYNLSVNLNHNQNNNTSVVNLNLPDINFNVNTLYPFQPQEIAGSGKWYYKLGIGYTGSARGITSFVDTSFTFKQMIDTFQWGAQHNIPISLALPQLGSIQISPGFSYQERMYSQKLFRTWNNQTNKVDSTVSKGFYSARDISMSVSFSTAMFGTLNMKDKNAKVQAIRHVMRPQMSIGYKPDLSKSYYVNTQTDTSGRRRMLSQYDGGVYGPFGYGRSGSIGFGIDNFLEMKVRDKPDSTREEEGDGLKKVKLIDGFGITGSYNLLADSFKLSTFNLYARSTLFDKINITASANIDPYLIDSMGFRINKYAWQDNKVSLGRFTNGSLSVSTSFKSREKDKDKKAAKNELQYDNYDNLTADEIEQQMDYVRRNPSEFVDFNIPWSINLSYSLSFSNVLRRDYSGFDTRLTSSAQFNGDFSLTEKWKVGANGYFDFQTLKIPSFSMFISREMHCWQMSINVTPFGLWRSFNISIYPKSGMLRDLKINRTRTFRNN
ncbi:putative LPS assembly protein LptD [Agriterribacter sp.]|uniref:putative LPS assembly protein LptD n=1 Tax=Agriterribacter sp. TaxID=2821509 RepID=UPI002CAC39AA|nr:putative LPS assembly protein LptD [Agriterribacter sp.]HTN06228.1 putative LPS assembly protein LptD [Agriterribacter sp.]